MKTKDHIVTTAIQLFNAEGTAKISTNHIAEAAGISPGNLYYHFRNKDEIIRAIFQRLFDASDVAFELPSNYVPTLADVEALVRVNFNIMWEYDFVYREMSTLIRNDSVLKARYLVVRKRGYEGFQTLLETLANAHVLIPLNPETIQQLADLCWLISESWLVNIDLQGLQTTPEHIQRGINLMMLVLDPYIVR